MNNHFTAQRDALAIDRRRVAAFIVASTLLLALAGWIVISQLAGNGKQTQRSAQSIVFEEETGIRILRLVLTAGGGMVDLQFQIADPDKALVVHDDETPPTITNIRTGQTFSTPFHDHAARELKTGVTYHELIMNSAGLLKRGDKVRISVGESILEDVVVQ
jgi:hypothetical protein